MADQDSTRDIREFLKGVEFPTDKQSLIDYADTEGASEDMSAMLELIPDGEYGSPQDVIDVMKRAA